MIFKKMFLLMNEIKIISLSVLAVTAITVVTSKSASAEGWTILDVARAEAAKEKRQKECEDIAESISRVKKQNELLSEKTAENQATYHAIMQHLFSQQIKLSCK